MIEFSIGGKVSMTRHPVVVRLKTGLHARPAALIRTRSEQIFLRGICRERR